VNIATFSLGRKDSGHEAISVIQTDEPVPENVLAELLKNSAIRFARPVKLSGEH
jgi:D-3-phosphoglycerate dehydrogenase / 2-oxoglutarate reductase